MTTTTNKNKSGKMPSEPGKFVEQFKVDLKRFVEETGIKPYRLADEAGVPRSKVYRFLSGEREGIKAETYIRLKEAMNRHFEEEVVWTPDPNPRKVNPNTLSPEERKKRRDAILAFGKEQGFKEVHREGAIIWIPEGTDII